MSVALVLANEEKKLSLSFNVFLAPTGALIVLMVYYSIAIGPQPLFEISSISANIFSFSF